MDHVTGSARSEDVRAHNLAALMSHLDLVGRASRSELSEVTGLVSGAVSSLVQELRDARLVRPAAPVAVPDDAPPRRGRPVEIVEIDGTDLGFLVVQFLVGQVRVLGTDLAGRVLHSDTRATETPTDAAALADALAGPTQDGLQALREAGARPVALALVAPAPVDPTTGRVPFSVDFGWHDVDLAALLSARLTDPPGRVVLLNDAQTAAHAETVAHRRATGRPVDGLVYLKADTGIGGGAVVGGRLLQGRDAFAFQPGHVVAVPGGVPCSCGKRGCLVTVAGPDVLLRAAGVAGPGAVGSPTDLARLFDRFDAGDPPVVEAVAASAAWLRLSLVNVCILLRPQVVVLGGYLGRMRDLLVAPQPGDGLGTRGLPGEPQVLTARHGDDSALQGALSLCRGTVLTRPGLARVPA